jgi:hypothetical protein
VTLEPLRPRAAHVVQLRSIAAVRQGGSDGPKDRQEIHPRFPHAISPRVLWARVSANTWKLLGDNVKFEARNGYGPTDCEARHARA